MDRVTEWIDTKLWDAIMNFHAHQQRIKQSHKEIDDLLEQLHVRRSSNPRLLRVLTSMDTAIRRTHHGGHAGGREGRS
jgi:hypothetical protein